MKITLKQYGGLAAVTRAPIILDTADLDQGRQEVERLVRIVSAQPVSSGSPHPDEMGYTLIIAGDNGTNEVRSTESAASPEFSRLVQQIRGSGKAG